jgi:NAD(P)-dependent dehydrogenase (short-subunit alcohol dehydrogenase family)
MSDTPVVVGGGSGIGAGVVAAYRDRGATPLVWDIAGNHDIECDVRDPQAIDNALSQTIERGGVPTEVTITAGVGHAGLLVDESVDDWDRVLAVNTRGPWLVMRAVAQALMSAGTAGSLVATSSVSARLVDRGMGTYCASKAALSMLVRVAACEWGPFSIRVNAIGPGVTETPMLGQAPTDSGWLAAVTERTALGRLGLPSDIANGILALHEMPWVTGQVLECDGGLGLHSPIDAYGESQRAAGTWGQRA